MYSHKRGSTSPLRKQKHPETFARLLKRTTKNAVDIVNKKQIHAFLFGAGASKAAMPNGAKNGMLVALMNESSQIYQPTMS